jgi:hypothetical protein
MAHVRMRLCARAFALRNRSSLLLLTRPCHFHCLSRFTPGFQENSMCRLLSARLRARWRLVASTACVSPAVLRTWPCAPTEPRFGASCGPFRTNRASHGLGCGQRFGAADRFEGDVMPSRQPRAATQSMPLLAAVRMRMAGGFVPLVWRSLLRTLSRRPSGRGGNLAIHPPGAGPPGFTTFVSEPPCKPENFLIHPFFLIIIHIHPQPRTPCRR